MSVFEMLQGGVLSMKIGKILYILAIMVLVGVFCVSAFYVGSYLIESQKQQAAYDELADIMESIQSTRPPMVQTTPANPEQEDAPEETTVPTEPVILPEYQPLYEMNDHMVGWIKIEGTKVNYPVMQTPEQENYYLSRGFDRQFSRFGSIYVRESCDVNRPSDNVTIYGHNMTDKSMFGALSQYLDPAFYEEHPIIIFDTLYEYHTYQIFAVFKTTASVGKGFSYHQFEDALGQEEFDEFVARCKELSFYETGHTPTSGDKLICLSTCEYTLENGRFVVVAYRVS